MSSASRAMPVLLAGIALLACLGATPGPRGAPPGSEYTAPDVPGIPADEKEQLLRERLLSRNERIARQRDRARARAEALEKVTDREARLPELNAWMRRMEGRFRLGGEVVTSSYKGLITTGVSGVADCTAIGGGPGMHCILNATWPVIDPRPTPRGRIQEPFPSEAMRTFNPAVLVLGVDPKLLEVRAMLVTDDTVTHSWAGLLAGDTLAADRVDGCIEQRDQRLADHRCITTLIISAAPDSEVEILLIGPAGIRFRLQRDPDAEPEKPMKSRDIG